MKNNRRDFLKLTGMAALGGAIGCSRANDGRPHTLTRRHQQVFNMANYAAEPLDVVRVGLIGVGSRGLGTIGRLSHIEGVEIKALCDLYPEKVNAGKELLNERNQYPDTYSGGKEEWKRLCDRTDLDLVYICTPWDLHAPQSIYAMEHGKHAATEIPAALTLEECWQLVEASEKNRRHCIQLTNVCYGSFEMVTLNMAKKGFMGEMIHGDGAYIHQLLEQHFSDKYVHHWRLRENATRNGNLYPHHGLGTISQMMDILHGDTMDFILSVSSSDFMMRDKAREMAKTDPFFEPFVDHEFRGNMNTSIIRTRKGRTIMLQHDVTSPRPYTRIHQVSGTRAIVRRYPEPMIATSHSGWLPEEEFNKLVEEYTPEIEKRVGEMARQVGGHGGMDTMLNWRIIDGLRNGLPMDLTVYEAALWSAVGVLSQWSVAHHSIPVEVPDFTAGAWESNKPRMDLELNQGGNTRII